MLHLDKQCKCAKKAHQSCMFFVLLLDFHAHAVSVSFSCVPARHWPAAGAPQPDSVDCPSLPRSQFPCIPALLASPFASFTKHSPQGVASVTSWPLAENTDMSDFADWRDWEQNFSLSSAANDQTRVYENRAGQACSTAYSTLAIHAMLDPR